MLNILMVILTPILVMVGLVERGRQISAILHFEEFHYSSTFITLGIAWVVLIGAILIKEFRKEL
jgi:uncharacterized membrane protein YidH (DUF202 family)